MNVRQYVRCERFSVRKVFSHVCATGDEVVKGKFTQTPAESDGKTFLKATKVSDFCLISKLKKPLKFEFKLSTHF